MCLKTTSERVSKRFYADKTSGCALYSAERVVIVRLNGVEPRHGNNAASFVGAAIFFLSNETEE